MPIEIEEIKAVKESYPELDFICEKQLFLGSLKVNHIYNDFRVNESFDIEIEVPTNYPHDIPIVREVSGKIKDYSHIYTNRKLCLGVDGEIMLRCNGEMNLKYLIDAYVIPYLFSYRYYERYQTYPFGERRHGMDGIFAAYMEYLALKDYISVYNFLKRAQSLKYRGHLPCPCDSGKIIRNCHAGFLKSFNQNSAIRRTIENDLKYIEEEVNYIEQHRKRTKYATIFNDAKWR